MGIDNTQNRKLKPFVLSGIALLAIVWALLPSGVVFESESVCMHYRWLGLQCPFCGLSRAGYEMLHLNIQEAWHLNPLIFYICWLYALEWCTFFKLPFVSEIRKISWWIGLGLAIMLYGLRILS